MITNVLTYWVTVEIQKLLGGNIDIYKTRHKSTVMNIMFLYSTYLILSNKNIVKKNIKHIICM